MHETVEQFLAREDEILRGLVGASETETIVALHRLNEQRVQLGLTPCRNVHDWRWQYAMEARVREILCDLSKQDQSAR